LYDKNSGDYKAASSEKLKKAEKKSRYSFTYEELSTEEMNVINGSNPDQHLAVLQGSHLGIGIRYATLSGKNASDDVIGNPTAKVEEMEGTSSNPVEYYYFEEDQTGNYIYNTTLKAYKALTRDEVASIKKENEKKAENDKIKLYSKFSVKKTGGKNIVTKYVPNETGEYIRNKNTFEFEYNPSSAEPKYALREDELAYGTQLFKKKEQVTFENQFVSFSATAIGRIENLDTKKYNTGSMGGILADTFRNMIFEIQARSTFEDGLGLRFRGNFDISAFDFKSLFANDFNKFINNTNWEQLELGVEIVEVANGRVVYGDDPDGRLNPDGTKLQVPKVRGGIYVANNKVYFDGVDIFDNVKTYTYVPNFDKIMKSIPSLIEKGKKLIEGLKETLKKMKTTSGTTDVRDSFLDLVLSNESLQLVLTKSIIKLLLATFAPQIGSLENVFDEMELNFGMDFGETVYKKVSEIVSKKEELNEIVPAANRHKATGEELYDDTNPDHSANKDKFVYEKKTVGSSTYYVFNKDGSSAGKYKVNFVQSGENDGLYIPVYKDGNSYYRYIVPEEGRYKKYDKVEWANNKAGRYAKTLINGVIEYIDLEQHQIYKKVSSAPEEYETTTDREGEKYVKYGSKYYKIEEYCERHIGYELDKTGEYFKYTNRYRSFDRVSMGLELKLGKAKFSGKVTGLGVNFGTKEELLPKYVKEGKSKKNTNSDVPLRDYTDTRFSFSTTLDFEMSVTEGVMDFGKIISHIVGELTGVTLETPPTAKGYSSAHLRADIKAMFDLKNYANSEINFELKQVSEVGLPNKWLGFYFVNDVLYMDLSYFGLPKVSVSSLSMHNLIKDIIETIKKGEKIDFKNLINKNAGAYTTAGDNSDVAASVLFDKRRVTTTVTKILIDWLLDKVELAPGKTLRYLINEQVDRSLDINFDIRDTLNFGLDINFGIQGERFNKVDKSTVEENKDLTYFDFVESSTGRYVEEKGIFRMLSRDEVNTAKRYEKREIIRTGASTYEVQKYVQNDNGNIVFDLRTRSYRKIKIGEFVEARYRYTRETDTTATVGDIYKVSKKTNLAENPYDTKLKISISFMDAQMYFTDGQNYSLSNETLKGYVDIEEMKTLRFKDTIDVTTLIRKADIIDLKDLLAHFLSSDDIQKIEALIRNGEGEDLQYKVELRIEGEVKLAAMVNYLRKHLSPNAEIDFFSRQFKIFDAIKLIKDLIDKKDLQVAELLNFVNAKMELYVNGNVQEAGGKKYYADQHKMAGIYVEPDQYKELTADEKDPSKTEYVAPKYRYSHYFKNGHGSYIYRDGKYVSSVGYDDTVDKYSYDPFNWYLNELGEFKKIGGSVKIDLSYMHVKSLSIAMEDLILLAKDLMKGKNNGAKTTADISLAKLNLKFPFLNDEITSVITAFLKGIRMTSSYIRMMITPDYINQILKLIAKNKEPIQFTHKFKNTSYAQMNTELINYQFKKEADATDDEISKSINRFKVTEDTYGSYYVKDGQYFLTDNLSSNELTEYINNGGKLYNIDRVDGYLYVDGNNDHNYDNVEYNGKYELTNNIGSLNGIGQDYLVHSSRATEEERLRARTRNLSGTKKTYRLHTVIKDKRGWYKKNLDGTYSKFASDHERNSYIAKNGEDSVYTFTNTDLLPKGSETGTHTYNAGTGEISALANGEYVYPVFDTELYIGVNTDVKKPIFTTKLYLWDYSATINLNVPEFKANQIDFKNVTPETQLEHNRYIEKPVYGYEKETLEGFKRKYSKPDSSFDIDKYIANPSLVFYRENKGALEQVPTEDAYHKLDTSELYKRAADGSFTKFDGITMADWEKIFDKNEDNVYLSILGGTKKIRLSSSNIYTKDELRKIHQIAKNGNLIMNADPVESPYSAAKESYVIKKYPASSTDGYVYDVEQNKYVPYATYTAPAGLDKSKFTRYEKVNVDYIRGDEIFNISTVLRGGVFLNNAYLHITEYVQMKKAMDPSFSIANIDVSNRYRNEAGVYIQDNDGDYVVVNPAGESEALGKVLGALLGNLKSKLEVAKHFTGEILFEVKINLSFEMHVQPKLEITIHDIDLALDVWRRRNDKNDNGILKDGSLLHIFGLYYNRDSQTGDAGLYLDLSWILGKEGKFAVKLKNSSVEEVVGKIITEQLLKLKGKKAAQTTSDPILPGADAVKKAMYLSILKNSVSVDITVGILKTIMAAAMENASKITKIFPNFKLYAKGTSLPYSMVAGMLLFNENGTKALVDIAFRIEGLNGNKETSSLVSYSTLEASESALEENRLKGLDDANYDPKKAGDYTFYYANFTHKENGNFKTDKDEWKKPYLRSVGSGDFDRDTNESGKSIEYKEMLPSAVPGYYDDENIYILKENGKDYELFGNKYNLASSKYKDIKDRLEFKRSKDQFFVATDLGYKRLSKSALAGYQGKIYKDTTGTEWDKHSPSIAEIKKGTKKVYKMVSDFLAYKTVMTIDLNQLVDDITKKTFDFKDFLKKIELNSVELSTNISLTASMEGVVNWTKQMSDFVNTATQKYLMALIAGLNKDENQAEKVNFDVQVQPKIWANVKNLTTKTELIDKLEGTKVQLDITITHKITSETEKTVHLSVFAEIKDGKLNAYLDFSNIDLGKTGNFLAQKIKLSFDLRKMLQRKTFASTTAGKRDVEGDEENKGILPTKLVEILNMLVGKVLLNNDLLSLGFNPDIITALVKKFAPELTDNPETNKILGYLPKLRQTYDETNSAVNLSLNGYRPKGNVRIGLEVGNEYYLTLDEYKDKKAENHFGGTAWNVSDGTFTKNADGTYSYANTAGQYVMVSNKEYALIEYAYPNKPWTGKKYKIDSTGNFVEDASGKYLKLGEARVLVETGDLKVETNKTFTAPAINASEYKELTDQKLRINTSLDFAFVGKNKTGENEVDFGAVLDRVLEILAPNATVANKLKLRIQENLGYEDKQYANLKVFGYIDFRNFANTQLKFVFSKYDHENGGALKEIFKAYYYNDSLFIDGTRFFGSEAKLGITNIGLTKMLNEKLGNVLNKINSMTTTSSVFEFMANPFNSGAQFDYPYLMMLVKPQTAIMQLNAMVINTLYRKMMQLRGKPAAENYIPDFGSILFKGTGTNSSGQTQLGGKIQLKLTESIKFGVETKEFSANRDYADSEKEFVGSNNTDLLEEVSNFNDATDGKDTNGMLRAKTAEDTAASFTKLYKRRYKTVLNVAQIEDKKLDISTLSLKMNTSVKLNLSGVKPGDPSYADSFAKWLTDLVKQLVAGKNMFGTFELINSESEFEGLRNSKIFVKDEQEYNKWKEVAWTTGLTFESGKYYKFKAFDLNILSDRQAVNLNMHLKADLNLPAIIQNGLSGILYSDIQLTVSMGQPFNRQLIKLTYLGSSKLKKGEGAYANQYYVCHENDLSNTDPRIFSDAAYIDASGLGLGKIKFQGIAGLLGAKQSRMVTTAGKTFKNHGALAIDILLSKNKVGVRLSKSIVDFVLDLANINLPFTLPPFSGIEFNAEYNDKGINKVDIKSDLDNNGTKIYMVAEDIGIKVNERLLDAQEIAKSVKAGYAGLTFSKTAGLTSLIQNVLDSINPAMTVALEKRSLATYNSGTSTFQWTHTAADVITFATMKIVRERMSVGTYNTISGSDITRLRVKVNATSPLQQNDYGKPDSPYNLDVAITGNDIYLTHVQILSGGLSGLDFIKKPLNVIAVAGENGQPKLQIAKPNDGDDNLFAYPTNATNKIKSGWSTAEKNGHPYTTPSMDELASDATRKYTYTPNLNNLIKKIRLNLFSDDGYTPNLSTGKIQGAGQGNSARMTLEATLDRDAYNQLVMMLTTTILGIVREEIDKDPLNFYYFVHWKVINSGKKINGIDRSGYAKTSDNHLSYSGKNQITQVLREFDEKVVSGASTQELVNFWKPILPSITRLMETFVTAGAAKLSGYYGTMMTLSTGWHALLNLAAFISGFLPLPFADYANGGNPGFDPKLKLYMDMNPDLAKYNMSGGKKLYPGLQAMELTVNCDREDGSMEYKYNKNPNSPRNYNIYNTPNQQTTNRNDAWNYMIMRITPDAMLDSNVKINEYLNSGVHYSKPMVGFHESEKIKSLISGSIPKEIVVTDPATRSAVMYSGENMTGTSTNVHLRDSELSNPATLPQYADLEYTDKNQTSTIGNPSAEYSNGRGTRIVWDASSIDFTPKKKSENGRVLVGYVYGYALNSVVAAIPVYINDDFALEDVKEVYKSGAKFKERDISLDINKGSKTFNNKLPSLVSIKFKSGSAYTFGEVAKNKLGKQMYSIVYDSNGQPVTLGKTPEGQQILNKDGNKYKLMPAFVAGLIPDGDDYLRDDLVLENGKGKYYKLDMSKLPSKGKAPIGSFEWNYKQFKYDWDTTELKVPFKYQWGDSNTITGASIIKVKNYKINEVKKFKNSIIDKTFKNLKFDSLKEMPANIEEFITKLDQIMTDVGTYDVKWDLTNLKKRLEEIAVRNASGEIIGYEYFKGINVQVTAYVGGNKFNVMKKLNDQTGKAEYGFMGAGSTLTDYTNNSNNIDYRGYYIAQKVDVTVQIKGSEKESINKDLVFDPYAKAEINDLTFKDEKYRVKIKGTEKPVDLKANQFDVEAPYVWNVGLGKYEPYNLAAEDITYEGYNGPNMYAKLIVKTPKLINSASSTMSNVINQEIYLPIKVLKMKAKKYTYKLKNYLNEEWYKSIDKLEGVSFEETKIKHDVKPIWGDKVTYYKDPELKEKVDNIFDGGKYYLEFQGNVYNASNEVMGLGNGSVEPQKFLMELDVEKSNISKVYFYKKDIYHDNSYETIPESELKDINNYTKEQYADYEGTGKLDAYKYVSNKDAYLKSAEFGKYREGTPVKVELENGETSIIFAKGFNLDKFNLNQPVTKLGVKLGKEIKEVDVAISSSTVKDIEFASPSLTKSGELEYKYDVQKDWSILDKAKVTTEDKSYENVDISWDKTYPGNTAEAGDIQNNEYFIRKATIFKGTEIEKTVDVKFVLDNKVSKSVVNHKLKDVEYDGDEVLYNAFTGSAIPNRADITLEDDPDVKEDVEVTFRSNFAPTLAEMRTGRFVRKATVYGDKSFDVVFKIKEKVDVKINGLEGTKYTLKRDRFFAGLEKKATVEISGTEYAGTVEWYYTKGKTREEILEMTQSELDDVKVKYTEAGIKDANVFGIVNINGDRHCIFDITMDVESRGDTVPRFTTTPTIDAFGLDANALLKNKDGEEFETEVEVGNEKFTATFKYSVPKKLEEDFADVVGKDIEMEFVCTNPDYTKDGTEKITFKHNAYVLNRDAFELSNPAYRNMTIDPTKVKSFKDLKLPNEVDVDTQEGQTVKMLAEWPSDSYIRLDGGEYTDAKVKLTYYKETSIGSYCYVEIDGVNKYMKISEYEELMKKTDPNYTYTGTRYAGYRVDALMPLKVLHRRVLDTEFELTGYTKIYEKEEGSYIVRTYEGSNNEYVRLYFGKNTNMPKKVEIANMYRFNPDFIPAKMKVRYGYIDSLGNKVEDCEKTFRIDFKGLPVKENMSFDSRKNYSMKMYVYDREDGDIEKTDFVLYREDVIYSISSAQLSSTNTNLASENMDITDTGLKHRFNVYSSEEDSMFRKLYQVVKSKVYLEGKFIAEHEWINYRDIEKLTGGSMYNLLKDGGNIVRYSIDTATRRFKADPNGDYVYMYSAVDEVNVDWNLDKVEYNYQGGRKYVEAKIRSTVFTSVGCVVRVPVFVNDATSTEETTLGSYDTSMFGEAIDRLYTLNRSLNKNFAERIPGYTGTRYKKLSDGTYQIADAEDPEAIYKDLIGTKLTREELALPASVTRYSMKKNGIYYEDEYGIYYKAKSGEYLEMTDIQKGVFKYLPNRVRLSNGAEVDAYWDISAVQLLPEGGEYRITLKVNGGNEYNYTRKDGSKKVHNTGIQKIYYTVKVKNLKATTLNTSENTTLSGVKGFINIWNSGEIEPKDGSYSSYQFKLNDFKNQINAITELKLRNSDGDLMRFKSNDTNGDGTFEWSFNEMIANASGRAAWLKANITLKDGTTQIFKIPFAFTEDTITKISNTLYTSNVSNDIASSTFEVDAYDINKHKVPSEYTVTYTSTSYKFTVNEFGYVIKGTTVSTTTLSANSDADVSMQSNYKLYISGQQTKGESGNATLYFGDLGKVTVPYNVKETSYNAGSWTGATLVNGQTLTTRINGVPVVWKGTVTVKRKDGTDVTTYTEVFASNSDSITLSAANNQKIVYKLKAYYGTVLDVNNNIMSGLDSNGNPNTWVVSAEQTVTVNG